MPDWLTDNFVTNFFRRGAAALGIGAVTFAGFNELLTWATSSIQSSLTGISGYIPSILGIACVDFAINMILSAYAIRITMKVFGRLVVGATT